MITSYSLFNDNPFSLKENVMAKLEMKEFSNLFDNAIFESSSDNLLLEKAYSTYELGLLYENRKDWFEDNDRIYFIDGEGGQTLLFKNESLFFVSAATLKMLKEQWTWGDVEGAWNSVKASASSAIDTVKAANQKAWDTISDGAKKVWEFSKRIASAAVEFVKSDPLTCAALFLQLMSGIISFIPAAGQVAGPICLTLAGIIEVYVGVGKIGKAWKKFSKIEVSNGAKAVTAFSEGAPYLIAGSVSILLGLNDVITAPKAAIPAAGATSIALRATSAKWSSSFAGQVAHSAEHFITNVAGKGAGKIGTTLIGPVSKFMDSGGSALAATLTSIIMIKTGKSVLGSLFDGFLTGIAEVSSLFSFVLSLPTKASQMMEKLIAAAQSPISEILIAPLKNIINPVVKFLGKLLDTYIRPMIDGLSGYLKAIVKERKTLESYANQMEVKDTQQVVKNQVQKVKTKEVEVSKQDLAKINAVKKQVKKNESLNHIQVFENFKIA
jgi:hypothetical protein